jgi:GMP synthase-like glutamine amidotransferase
VPAVWLKLLKERSDKEEWHVYRTAEKGELPTVDDDYHGVIIPGSSHSCYEDLEWIHRLKDYIRACFIPLKADHHSMEHSKKPQIVGSCFGCQLIAETLGGYVTKNPRGRYIVQVRQTLREDDGSGPTAVGLAVAHPVLMGFSAPGVLVCPLELLSAHARPFC